MRADREEVAGASSCRPSVPPGPEPGCADPAVGRLQPSRGPQSDRGSGQAGDFYLLFLGLGLAPAPATLPWFAGPVHLDPNGSVFLGLFLPLGPTVPYHSLSFPANPAWIGLRLYDQALALHVTGLLETTPVDCFAF